MAQWLRFGTAVGIHVGPAVATGGFTRNTSLTATNVTSLRLIKHTATTSISATGRTFAHIIAGQYRLSLTSTDTNTLGHLLVDVRASGAVQKALPIFHRYSVVPAMVFDSLISGSDRLFADVRQWAGTNTATTNIALQPVTDMATASEVWTYTTRVLTSGAVAWTAAGRTLSSGSAVWSVAARTLTSGGNVASSVWGRTLAAVTGVPGATAAARLQLGFVYVGTRNRRRTTATGDILYSNACGVIAKAVVSASSTAFQRNKFVTATA